MPFVEREGYQISSKCRLHPDNDLFRDQEQSKIHIDVNDWQCGYCKKSFRAEKFLDQHLDSRHSNLLNVVCGPFSLSTYILRCFPPKFNVIFLPNCHTMLKAICLTVILLQCLLPLFYDINNSGCEFQLMYLCYCLWMYSKKDVHCFFLLGDRSTILLYQFFLFETVVILRLK